MKHILFVCHGNICRSPMAEVIFRDLTQRQGCGEQFFVASRATSREEIWNGVGNPVYPPARAELARHGLDCTGMRACQLIREDYDRYDLLLGMDDQNIRNMLRITGGDPEGKIGKLMDFTPQGGEVADPWYTGQFDLTYRDILAGCTALLERLRETGSGVQGDPA